MKARSAVFFLCIIGVGTPASAAPDELIVAVEPGYERRVQPDGGQDGVGGSLSAWLGLTDSLWLMGSAGLFGVVRGDEGDDDPVRYEVMGGIVGALDVFRIVPFVELGAGVVGVKSQVLPTVRLGAGLDYLLNPQWAVGAVLRYRPLPEEDLAQAAISAQLRLSFRFED